MTKCTGCRGMNGHGLSGSSRIAAPPVPPTIVRSSADAGHARAPGAVGRIHVSSHELHERGSGTRARGRAGARRADRRGAEVQRCRCAAYRVPAMRRALAGAGGEGRGPRGRGTRTTSQVRGLGDTRKSVRTAVGASCIASNRRAPQPYRPASLQRTSFSRQWWCRERVRVRVGDSTVDRRLLCCMAAGACWRMLALQGVAGGRSQEPGTWYRPAGTRRGRGCSRSAWSLSLALRPLPGHRDDDD